MQIWQPHKHTPKFYKAQFARWNVYNR